MTSPGAPSRWRRRLAQLAVLLVLSSVAGTGWITRRAAHDLITNPDYSRPHPRRTPADVGIQYQSVFVIAEDGIKTVGWYLPGENGALVLVQHGYKAHRGQMLGVAAMLRRHGYGVLVTTTRGHDTGDGEQITFGIHEMKDLAAWHAFARTLAHVDRARLGMFGSSMGGSLVIQYAAGHPDIRAVVADSAFSSLDDTVSVSVPHQTGLPAFPFAPLIVFWAEREAGFESASIDAKQWIGKIAPRPVLLLQGGRDVFISPDSGERLYEAAGEPKELWFDPDVGHTMFERDRPEQFEERISRFFDRYLSGATGTTGTRN
jgi:uncharacterized protein